MDTFFADLWCGGIYVAKIGEYHTEMGRDGAIERCEKFAGQTMREIGDDIAARLGIPNNAENPPMYIDTTVHDWDARIDYWQVIAKTPDIDGEGSPHYVIAESE